MNRLSAKKRPLTADRHDKCEDDPEGRGHPSRPRGRYPRPLGEKNTSVRTSIDSRDGAPARLVGS